MNFLRLFLLSVILGLSLPAQLFSADDYSSGIVSSATSNNSGENSLPNFTLDEEAIRNIPKDDAPPEAKRPIYRNPLTIIAFAVIAIGTGFFLSKRK